jgi:hypothetical protein
VGRHTGVRIFALGAGAVGSRHFILKVPEEINGWFAFVTALPAPPFPVQLHLQKKCSIVWCYSGALEQAETLFQPIGAKVPPVVDCDGPIPWPVLQSHFDALYAPDSGGLLVNDGKRGRTSNSYHLTTRTIQFDTVERSDTCIIFLIPV